MAKSRDATLDPDAAYQTAMRALIAPRWRAVWDAIPIATAGDNPDGVHDVRVASRRLRAAMDVAVGCFPAAWYRPLYATAKEITSALGEVRDRDVLLEAFHWERAQAPEHEWPGIDRLISRIEHERAAARTEMLAFLEILDRRGIANATVRRFGPDAAATDSAETSR